jgi:hypothetical protein
MKAMLKQMKQVKNGNNYNNYKILQNKLFKF